MPQPIRASDIPFTGASKATSTRTFTVDDHLYKFEVKPAGIWFELDRVRRSSQELWGELVVRVNGNFPEARSLEGGILQAGDLNLSSVQARSTRAKLLAERAGDKDIDWYGLVEDFAIRIIGHERAGSPDLDLKLIPRPEPDRLAVIDGVQLPLFHPTILFGDGGSAKSYLAMYWCGRLVEDGHRVLYADWEFTPDEHRERLEFLFGPGFPSVRYLACFRSFREERERIARAVRNQKIDYLVCDSVALACGGDPSSSEACTTYFQSLRTLGNIGSLHIAHVTKGLNGRADDQKPFGSAFWHNMARVSYNIKSETVDESTIAVGLFPRKRNLKGRSQEAAFRLQFGETHTTVTRTDVREHAGLSEGLPLSERINAAIGDKPLTRKELADLLGVEYAFLQRVVHRDLKRKKLVEIESATRRGQLRIGLPVKEPEAANF